LYSITEAMGTLPPGMGVAGDYFTMREQKRGISEVAAFDNAGVTWTGQDGSHQLFAAQVTASFFPALGVQPLHGRWFLPQEDQPAATPVAVLSHALWQRRFASDPKVVGATIRINRRPTVVAGIMPRGFDYPSGTDLWLPIAMNEAEQRQRQSMRIIMLIARAGPGMDPSQVNSEMARLQSLVQAEYPPQVVADGFLKGMRIYATPLRERLFGTVTPALLVFSGAVGLMLMIVCFNLANLMLAKATARHREIAVRAALGAPRNRIVAQLLSESMLVSLLGGSAGLGLAIVLLKALNASREWQLARLPAVSLDLQAAFFALAITVATGLLCGLAPAFGSLRVSVRDALQRETRTASGGSAARRMRQGLVVAQLGLSLTLLIGAGLLGKSFLGLRNTDPGFHTENILTARIALPQLAYPSYSEQYQFFERLLMDVRRLPGVEAAAAANAVPFGTNGLNSGIIRVEGQPAAPPPQAPRTAFVTASDNFLETLGVPLRLGRWLSASDTATSTPSIVVNQAFVTRYLSNQDPLRTRIAFGAANAPPAWLQIVGVAGDIRQMGLDRDPEPMVYLSTRQSVPPTPFLGRIILVLRTSAAADSLTGSLQKIVAGIDRDLPVFDVLTLEQRLADSLGSRRFNALLIGSFAAVSVFLAAIGIYGVMSYLVTLRSHELGIRLALGARPPQIMRMILRQGAILGLIGTAIGIAGALALSKFLSTLLFGVDARDAAIFSSLAILLLGIVLIASYLPSRRAAHADPVRVLRHEG
jgi:predicted permease